MRKRQRAKRRYWQGEDSLRYYTDNAIEAAAPVWRSCLRAFADWLREERGLALSTIITRVTSVRYFVESLGKCGGLPVLESLSVTQIEDFFIEYGACHGPALKRSMQAGVRLFLRFAASKEWTKNDLVGAVMSLRAYRLSSVPRGLDSESVCRLVAASAEKSARDHSIVLLLAIYGLRRGQICELRLGDIDWRRKTIIFRAHKRGKTVLHELVPAVAEALSKYLRNERPMVDSQAVFLRTRKPYLPLGPSALTTLVDELMHRQSIAAGTRRGPHTLRHAFATRLMQNGQPLKVIADLLGHRSLDAAAIYAKVDHPRLLEVADEWPEVMS